MRKGLLYSLFIMLAQAETGVPDDMVFEKTEPLASLIRQCEGNPDATIITTNYDLLIEYAASEHMSNWVPTEPLPENPINYGLGIRYGVGLSSSWEALNCKPYTPDEKQCVCLKLHGSVNWLYCPQCSETDWMGIRPLGAAEALAELWKCCKCGNKYQQLIVPPGIGKSPVYPVLKGVWNHASNRLEQAECIVFAGFSLRQDDMDIRNLLLLANTNSQSLREVILVDPAADDLLPRYKGIYGSLVQIYRGRDWKTYLDECIPIRPRS
ncbi:SIR2 family protein [Acidobacteriia bacterium AH_259_A11_L15]|nr:SIR2 family protein [Acidobacteriia bacterium AH_259_A11_L15]